MHNNIPMANMLISLYFVGHIHESMQKFQALAIYEDYSNLFPQKEQWHRTGSIKEADAVELHS
uniref:Uncharacterized protein n=1 Tax=Arundo donax TaxID=35708 RepID=A0A0A9F4X3_ARUDO